MLFGIFVLNRVSNLSFFVLIRVSIFQFLSQTGYLFLDDKQQTFYKLLLIKIRVKCLKQGIKNRNSVLNRVGKSAIFVLNRVRVWGAVPHLLTQGYIEYPPPPWAANPIIYRLVPSPSRFEIRQWRTKRTSFIVFFFPWPLTAKPNTFKRGAVVSVSSFLILNTSA